LLFIKNGDGFLRNKQSLKTWGIIFAILIGSGILTILLPALLDGGSTTSLPREQTAITIPVPFGGDPITLPGWQVMLALALLVPGLVIGAGITLWIVMTLVSRFVSRTTASVDYQQNSAALQKRETERIARMRETRPTSAAPPSTWRRWSVITTAAIVLTFAAFTTLLFSRTLFPDGQIVRQDTIVNIGSLLVLVVLGIALLFMALWLRADRIEAFNRGDSLTIPWDFIAVVVTGLLVVGLGIGVIAIINAP
jgi:hypothetical protein